MEATGHASNADVWVAFFGAVSAVAVTARWMIRKRGDQNNEFLNRQQGQLNQLSAQVETISSEGKETRAALNDNTRSYSDLKTDVRVLETQMGNLQEVVPKAIELMEIIVRNETAETLVAKKIAPDATKITKPKEGK